MHQLHLIGKIVPAVKKERQDCQNEESYIEE